MQADDAPAIVLSQFKPKGLVRRVALRRLAVARPAADRRGARPGRSALRSTSATARCAPSSARSSTWPPSTAARSIPTDLDEYLHHDGFEALRRCVEQLSPEEIIARGEAERAARPRRGGLPHGRQVGGRPRRRRATRSTSSATATRATPAPSWTACSWSRSPTAIIEGMAIAARAVGADEGIFYIRAEYPLAVQRISEALRRCEERGLLGDRILGTDFRLHLSVKEGAGAFVCGEETALLASLEGRRGMPRLRPPYPAECGLWGKPTSVNNVETYALVPWIFRHGAAAFAALGTAQSKGTKVFALAGKVARGGLIEVPMGITIRQIVEEIGGGVAGGRRFKAVQVGGPSGGCVPAELADTPVDYEALAAGRRDHGLRRPGRAGRPRLHGRYRPLLPPLHPGPVVRQVYVLPHRHAADARHPRPHLRGRGPARATWRSWNSLARTVSAGSICGLGRTAPNPVLSTLRYFRESTRPTWQGRCPAGQVQGPDHATASPTTASAARSAPSSARPTRSR